MDFSESMRESLRELSRQMDNDNIPPMVEHPPPPEIIDETEGVVTVRFNGTRILVCTRELYDILTGAEA
jgi:hypothetical protein